MTACPYFQMPFYKCHKHFNKTHTYLLMAWVQNKEAHPKYQNC